MPVRDAPAAGVPSPRGQPHGFGVLQVGVDTGHDRAGLDGQQFDPYQRDAGPGIDNDALVQDPVYDFRQTTGRIHFFLQPYGSLLVRLWLIDCSSSMIHQNGRF